MEGDVTMKMDCRVQGYDYNQLVEDINKLQNKYEGIPVDIVGFSVMGKQIPVIKLGSGAYKVHYNGSFHANEWITSLLLMRFVEAYVEAVVLNSRIGGQSATKLWTNCTLWIIPMVNPDGVDLVVNGITAEHPYAEQLITWNRGSLDFQGWKSNVMGVDLNDQFPAQWDIERNRRGMEEPGPRDYSGPAPLSEPEAMAIAQFTTDQAFDLVMAFHTQGREIYWNYRDLEPMNAEAIATRLGHVSGYMPVRLTDSDAGYKDWFIQEFRKPGFTIEAGLGVNPLPIEQFKQMFKEVLGIMVTGMLQSPGS